MRANRGFTLLEMAVTVAIIAIVTALAIPTMRAARRNATVQATAFEVALRLDGLRNRALRDQRDLLAIVVDAPGNDPSQCPSGNTEATCASYYVLAPGPGFVLEDDFSPGARPANAEYVEHEILGHGVKFYLPAAGRDAPVPFDAVSALDGQLLGDCKGASATSRSCVGIRFRSDGEVSPEWPDGVELDEKLGVSFVLGSDVDRESAGSDQRGVVVTFPTGLVRAYPVAR